MPLCFPGGTKIIGITSLFVFSLSSKVKYLQTTHIVSDYCFAKCIIVTENVFTEPEAQTIPHADPPGGYDKRGSTPSGAGITAWPPMSALTEGKRGNYCKTPVICMTLFSRGHHWDLIFGICYIFYYYLNIRNYWRGLYFRVSQLSQIDAKIKSSPIKSVLQLYIVFGTSLV